MTRRPLSGPRRHDRGTIYVLVLLVSTIVTTMGLAGLLLARIEVRTVESTSDMGSARALAISAVDLGLLAVDSDQAAWQATLQANAGKGRFEYLAAAPLGGGTLAVDAISPADSSTPRLIGVGVHGSSRHMVEVGVEIIGGTTTIEPGSWRQIVD